jgi:periplasmic divalent cation tolerance protein
MTDVQIVTVTTVTDSAQAAEQIALALVEGCLAACVQVGAPVTSVFRWEGKVERSQEWPVVAKTTAAGADAVVAAIVAAHSYAVPEVLVTAVTGGHDAYLEWAAGEVFTP